MPNFAVESRHQPIATVASAAGSPPVQVKVRGQVVGETDGGTVTDSPARVLAPGIASDFAPDVMTMPGTPGTYRLHLEVWWRNADGTGEWTKTIGPAPFGDPVVITAAEVPTAAPSLSITSVRWVS